MTETQTESGSAETTQEKVVPRLRETLKRMMSDE